MSNTAQSLPLFSYPYRLLRRGTIGRFTQTLLGTRLAQLALDQAIIAGALLLSYLIRFDGVIPEKERGLLVVAWGTASFFYLASGLVFHRYRPVWRFVSLSDSIRLFEAVGTAASLCLLFNLLLSTLLDNPRVPLGILILHPILVLGGWIGLRLLRRVLYSYRSALTRSRALPETRRLLLVGAGVAGQNLARELRRHPEFSVVGFVDDNPALQNRLVEGLPVLGTTRQISDLVGRHRVKEVTLCMPSASKEVARRILRDLEGKWVRTTSVPSLSEILLGHVTISRLRAVEMEDLLGRSPVSYGHGDNLNLEYREKCILVTGAGGSIGSELVRQLREFSPSRLILLDKDENSLYEICLETSEVFSEGVPIVGDIRDSRFIDSVFAQWKPEVVFHAAAYKHVPLMELHPVQAIATNVFGSLNIIKAASNHGCHSFVFVSTDKAVNPTNVMGASKRIGELLLQREAARAAKGRYCVVRFGNVLGSRGSVVPLFQKRINQGKTVEITHPEITRYFMTIPEAVQLVIQAGSLGQRGEIFVLDMGKPVRILDLAKNLIRLSGLVPEKDIGIRFCGLRPGEKLHEELLVRGENGVRNTKYQKIFVATSPPQICGSDLEAALRRLEKAVRDQDENAIRAILSSLDIGYRPPLPESARALSTPYGPVQEERRIS